jgi:hypothetical protein
VFEVATLTMGENTKATAKMRAIVFILDDELKLKFFED